MPTEIINQLIQFKPEILFPLKTTDNIFGFMMLSSNQGKQYSQDDIEFISSIASFASVAIQNKKNYLKAITDLKTGLYIYTYLTFPLSIITCLVFVNMKSKKNLYLFVSKPF